MAHRFYKSASYHVVQMYQQQMEEYQAQVAAYAAAPKCPDTLSAMIAMLATHIHSIDSRPARETDAQTEPRLREAPTQR